MAFFWDNFTTLPSKDTLTMNNPLLEPSSLPYGAPQFDKIELHHLKEAAIQAAKELRSSIDAINCNPEAATFDNTIKALLFANEKYENFARIYWIFFNCKRTKELVTADAEDVLETNDIPPSYLEDKVLFDRVQQLYNNRETLCLSAEEHKILEDTYNNYLNKLSLSDEDKAEYARVSNELSTLESKFKENCIGVYNSTIHIKQDENVSGIPNDVLTKAEELAKRQGVDGWIFSLKPAEYSKIMESCKDRNVRMKVYKDRMSRFLSEPFDNSDIVKKIIEDKIKLCNLLGFKTNAEYLSEKKILNSTEKVHEFLDGFGSSVLEKAEIEEKELLKFAIDHGYDDTTIEAWDYKFWKNILFCEKYSVDQNLIRQYLPISSVLEGIFKLITDLYGITFVERRDLPIYEEHVRAFEVKEANGEHLGLLYLDLFQRDNKIHRSYTSTIRRQSLISGTSPIVLVVTNFTNGKDGAPALLSMREFECILHELGHALHNLFSKVEYAINSCGCKELDFSEFPSILMQQWAYNREFLKACTSHYITGDTMPESIINALIESHNWGLASSLRYQVKLSALDMAWAELADVPEESVFEFEKNAAKKYSIARERFEVISHNFTHIFCGRYFAGYYSYLLGMVTALDAYSMFMNPNGNIHATAYKLRKEILEKGRTKSASEMFFAFSGHYPSEIKF